MNEIHDVERQRLFSSISISIVIWIALSIILIFIPNSPKKVEEFEFPPVTITFSQVAVAPEVVSKQPAASQLEAGAPQPAASQLEAVAPQPPASQPKVAAKQPPASQPKVTAQQPATGLGIPDFEKPTTTATRSAQTLDFKSTDYSPPKDVSIPVQEMEGSVAIVQSPSNKTSSSGESISQNKTQPPNVASQSTLSTLDTISSTAIAGTVDSGASKASTSSSAPRSSVATDTVSNLVFDLSSRKLLTPKDPSIVLPANLARLVDSDREVTVVLTVTSDGRVPSGLIVFSPSAVLPQQIRDYLREQFSAWRFESANQDGQARFLYSIKIK